MISLGRRAVLDQLFVLLQTRAEWSRATRHASNFHRPTPLGFPVVLLFGVRVQCGHLFYFGRTDYNIIPI